MLRFWVVSQVLKTYKYDVMKVNIALLILPTLFVISCTDSPKKQKKEVREQDKFIELVSQSIDSINSCVSSNPIELEKRKDKRTYYNKQFFKLISNFADSNLIIKNWNGVVRRFDYLKKEKSSFILLDIIIEYKGNKHLNCLNDKIILQSIYDVDNTLKDTDIVFNNMAKINENSNVYIEGFFNRSMNGYISVGNNLSEFDFTILNISTSPTNDSMSINLKEAINRKFDEMKILGRGMLKGKTEKEIIKECAYLNKDSITNTLNSSENQYIDRIERAYITNLAKEYVNR